MIVRHLPTHGGLRLGALRPRELRMMRFNRAATGRTTSVSQFLSTKVDRSCLLRSNELTVTYPISNMSSPAIKAFKPRDYWEIHAKFQGSAGEYEGRWFDEGFTKQKNGDSALRAERIWDNDKAESIVSKCTDKTGK